MEVDDTKVGFGSNSENLSCSNDPVSKALEEFVQQHGSDQSGQLEFSTVITESAWCIIYDFSFWLSAISYQLSFQLSDFWSIQWTKVA